MHRYGNIDYILTLDIDDFINMFLKAKKENAIEQLWQQWLVDFGSHMTKETFISFQEYKKKAFKINVKLDKKKILDDALKIKEADQKRR